MQYKNKLNEDEEGLIIIPISWEKIEYEKVCTHGKNTDAGLYQIYGRHHAYGPDSLLYIGQAGNFSERINEKRWFNDFLETTVEPDFVRLGRIAKSNDKKAEVLAEEDGKLWSEFITLAEKLLISTHTPAFNSQLDYKLSGTLQNWTTNGRQIIVLNFGDRGSLLPEVSTFRNSYTYYTYETPFGTKVGNE